MVYVNLPAIHPELVGTWPVSDAERVVTARIVATLPSAPSPDADPVTGWNAAVAVVRAAIVGMSAENAPELWARVGPEGMVAPPRGQLDMLGMPHVLAQGVAMAERYVEWLDEERARGEAIERLTSFGREVEQFRSLLADAAAGD